MDLHPCNECGAQSRLDDQFCGWCGAKAPTARKPVAPAPDRVRPGRGWGSGQVSDRRKLVILVLWWFLGIFGAHRFYMGHLGTGLAMAGATALCGFGAIWGFVDGLVCLIGTPEDGDGRRITQWT